MARIIVSFDTEKQAQESIAQLIDAGLGEVRSRVLDSSEPMSYSKTEDTSPVITPEMGSVEVRPTENPVSPQGMREEADEEASASIPTTGPDAGEGAQGIEVEIEVDDQYEEQARRILGMPGSR